MTSRIFALLGSSFLALGILVYTPSANPTTIGKGSENSVLGERRLSPNTKAPHPLAVWECITSWYGEDFDGLPTATGETYDMYGETAAHPTLPLGSIVRVVNTRNHRSQIVRINDRGPYVEGRELDVSYQVAKQLGFDQHGTAKVRLELLELPSHPPADHHD